MANRAEGMFGPVADKQRIAELDVLRGLALLGVLVVNFTGFAGSGFGMTEAQAAALPTANIDRFAGQVGTFFVLLICIAFFALQTLLSAWWLGRYRFGPMEWLWRALTYRERPAFRRGGRAAAVPA